MHTMMLQLCRGYIPFMTNYEYTCEDCGTECINKKAASKCVSMHVAIDVISAIDAP